jgi:miniconductance mechanosensitive channel
MIKLQQYLIEAGWKPALVDIAVIIAGFALLLIAACVIYLINKKLIIKIIERLIKSTRYSWDDVIFDEKVFHRSLYLLPAILIKWLIPIVFISNERIINIAQITINISFIIISLVIADALLNAVITGYRKLEVAKRLPIKGAVQATKIIVNAVGFILVLSVLLGKTPIYFLSGLGAATAILLLIFKDAILGLVAGIQLAANNMVQTGDWIEIPKHGADGEVMDVTLTTVKVQNWDKTIVSVPAYELISSSFKNWRAMEEAKGRQIKRNIYVDVNSIKFADKNMVGKFKKIKFLKDYIEQKEEEIARYNKKYEFDISVPVNGRHITNIGTFRIYCEEYLKNSDKIRKDYTLMVRQLAPESKGLPLQIYAFVNDTNWVAYEKIQSDIFDHLLSILSYFDLKIFQEPAGSDVRALVKK